MVDVPSREEFEQQAAATAANRGVMLEERERLDRLVSVVDRLTDRFSDGLALMARHIDAADPHPEATEYPHPHPFAVADHEHDASPPPAGWSPPDPTRGGFELAHAVNIASAGGDDELNVAVHEGEPHGVRLESFEGTQVLAFEWHPGDREWKGTGGHRSEINYGSLASVGQGDQIRDVAEIRFEDDALTPPGFQTLITTQQWHSTSKRPQHSPTFGMRRFDGSAYGLYREGTDGRARQIGDDIQIPPGVYIREEITGSLSAGANGWAVVQVWNMETGEELTNGSQRFDGPTLLPRDGRDYDPRLVRFYPKRGIYLRAADQRMRYRCRLAEVYRIA